MKKGLSTGSLLALGGFLFTLVWCWPALAGDSNRGQWQFHLAPYAWLAGQKGTVATQPGLPPADIDIDFHDDIAGNINGSLFLVGEARKGRYGLVFDIAYTDVEDGDATGGPLFSNLKTRTQSWIASVGGFYRLVDKNQAFMDVLAGVRYWSVDSSLTLETGILPARELSNREDWFDPVLGLKGLSFLGQSNFFFNGSLLIGGFGLGSDFMWDVNLNLGYRWTQTFSTTLGYRYLDVDYENDGFLYDVAQHGPVLGLSWRF